MSCIIRPITMQEAEALFQLVTDFATSFQPERKAFEESLTQLLADESAWLWGAEWEGKLIGYCLGSDHYAFYANGRVSWVEEIMVQDIYRGRGVGRALMEAFEAWAYQRKSRLIGLATRRAAPFYTALGYENSATFFRKLL